MRNLYQSLVAVEPFTLLVTIGNLFVQMYIIKRFLLARIRKIVEQRREMAEREISEAQNAKGEALKLKDLYTQSMDRAQQEVHALVEQARKKATEQSEKLLTDTQSEIVQMKEKAQADFAREKEKMVSEAKHEIFGLALEIAEKVVGRSMNEVDRQRLTDDFIEQLGEEL